jgi:hypothetical protein
VVQIFDDVVIAGAFGARLQCRQIGAGAGLGIALAPPVLAAQNARQEACLLLLVAVLQDHRADHLDPEGQHLRRANGRSLAVVDEALRR